MAAYGAVWMCLAQGPLEAQKLARLERIETQSGAGLTKIFVDLNGDIDISSQRIENPARVFVDFQAAVPALSVKAGGILSRAPYVREVGDGLVKQVRVAENQKGVTRLVLDLVREDVEFRTAVVGKSRLLIEVKAAPSVGKMRNPLAEAPVVKAVLRPAAVEPKVAARPYKPNPTSLYSTAYEAQRRFWMSDPPVLRVHYRLPKAEAKSIPYHVSGFVTRDFQAGSPASLLSGARRMTRQAANVTAEAVAATSTSSGRRSLTRVLGLKIGRVVIDPGHGGHDAGTTGPSGLTEKELTLDVAKRLGELVEEEMGSEVVYTRTDDRYISPEERGAFANRNKADLFISIHVNSSPQRSATGVETYYLNFTSSPEALEVAARENAVGERSVNDLGDLIKKIALKDKIDESREFAGKVQAALFSGASKAGNRTRDRGVRKAPFMVLIGATMPSILTEIGFLSNPKEEALLKKPEYRQKVAEALFQGISQYASTLSHFSVARGGAPVAPTAALQDEND